MLNLMLKTILSFLFLSGRSWVATCANKITTDFSSWLDPFPLCSGSLLHAIHFFPNTVLCRGLYVARSGLKARIRNQAVQRQEDADVVFAGCSHFEFLGFHHQKSQQLLRNAGFVHMRLEVLQRAKSSPASRLLPQIPDFAPQVYGSSFSLNPSFKREKTIPVCSTASVNTPY